MKNARTIRGGALRLTATLLILSAGAAAQAQIEFEDVSAAAGMKGFTETWGASWGDINGDNWPDLFNQGHREYPRMFRNTGEGAFQDIAYEVDPGNWVDFVFDDKHGATWVDFDNDGDDDLLIAVSDTGPGQLMVNTDGKGLFVDRGADSGLNGDRSARMGTFFDYDNDGNLDVIQGYTENALVRRRDPNDAVNPDVDFDLVSWETGVWCPARVNYQQLMDIDGDGTPELFCMREGIFPLRVYDYTTLPFTDVTTSVPLISNVNDTIVADFNNDGLSDMLLSRGAMRPTGAALVNPNRIEAWIRKDDAAPVGKGFEFVSDGMITVTIDHKGQSIFEDPTVYVLDPLGQTTAVLAPLPASPDGSLRIDFVGNGLWRVEAIDEERSFEAYLQIETLVPVTNLVDVALDFPELPTNPVLLENGPSGLTQNSSVGLSAAVSCVSVVAGDFDNDMDQDIYMVCRNGPSNLANRIYENQGDGTFVEITGHGAEGPQGTGFEFGVGESAVLADYDVDGFLDIYVANGLLFYPINEGGPENLFRNTGNGNHWLEIDLAGTVSNRDGLGAKVWVTAGGVTQLREQNGGYHRWSQNDQRVHVGLGSNTTADVMIEWPSGTVDNFTAVAADALYVATEAGTLDAATLGPPVYTELAPGDECRQPPYSNDYGPALLLWKNCTDNIWSLRARGGREQEARNFAAGTIIGDGPFSGLTPVNLNSVDTLEASAAEVIEFSVGAWFSNNKGFNFSTAGQSTSCLSFATQDFPIVILGNSGKTVTGGIDLVNLMPCDPPPPIDLAECGEPVFDNNTENALFAWRDCDFPSSAVARWNFSLSSGGQPFQTYQGVIESDVGLTAVGFDIEPNDTLDTVPGDILVDFELKVGGNGIDSFQVDVPQGSISCLQTMNFPAGVEVLVGEDRLLETDNFDLLTLETCESTCHP